MRLQSRTTRTRRTALLLLVVLLSCQQTTVISQPAPAEQPGAADPDTETLHVKVREHITVRQPDGADDTEEQQLPLTSPGETSWLTRGKVERAWLQRISRAMLGALPQLLGPHECAEPPPPLTVQYPELALKAGKQLVVASAKACQESCRVMKGCAEWVWCGTRNASLGCYDAYGDALVHHGCQLRRRLDPRVRFAELTPQLWQVAPPPDCATARPYVRSFQSGYLPGTHAASVEQPELVRYAWTLQRADSVLLVTAIAPQPCLHPTGDYMHQVFVRNKQQYAALHGYGLLVGADALEPSLAGRFNKWALLGRALEQTPREQAEWLVWLDGDTIIGDMMFSLPFKKYGSADLVVKGRRRDLLAGNYLKGVETAVMMLRNTQWSRDLVSVMEAFGRVNYEVRQELLGADLVNYDSFFVDQPALNYILRHNTTWLRRITFERAFCLNCWWGDTNVQRAQPWVMHYAGCLLCKEREDLEGLVGDEQCLEGMMQAYAYSQVKAVEFVSMGSGRQRMVHASRAWDAFKYYSMGPLTAVVYLSLGLAGFIAMVVVARLSLDQEAESGSPPHWTERALRWRLVQGPIRLVARLTGQRYEWLPPDDPEAGLMSDAAQLSTLPVPKPGSSGSRGSPYQVSVRAPGNSPPRPAGVELVSNGIHRLISAGKTSPTGSNSARD